MWQLRDYLFIKPRRSRDSPPTIGMRCLPGSER
jgi:hypothetical protein